MKKKHLSKVDYSPNDVWEVSKFSGKDIYYFELLIRCSLQVFLKMLFMVVKRIMMQQFFLFDFDVSKKYFILGWKFD